MATATIGINGLVITPRLQEILKYIQDDIPIGHGSPKTD